MNNFKKEGFRKGGAAFGGKPRFGGGNKFGGGNRGSDRGSDRGHGPIGDGREREMFKAKCSACFKACEVPFRPTSGKPVYCRDCFADNAPSDRSDRTPGRGDSRGGEFRRDERPQRAERPAFREEVRAPRENNTDDLKRQIANLESKVDHILELLKKRNEAPVVASAAKVEKTEEIATEAPKKVRKPKSEKKKAPAKKAAPKKKAKK